MRCKSNHSTECLILSAIYLLALVILQSTIIAPGVHARSVQNILVLHSYHQGLLWTDSITTGIESELKADGDDIEIHYEYLDTKRNSGEQYYQHLVAFETYKTQLANIDFDLIISSDNNALRFIVEHGDQLFPGTPVVFCGVNNFHRALLKGKRNITGVVEFIDYSATLKLMHRLHPKRNRVLVVLDKTPTGRAIQKELDTVIAKMDDIFEITYYQDFKLNEVGKKIATLGSKDIIYTLTFNRDRENNFISYVDGIRMIRSTAKVPIYGSWDFYFGKGIIGGMITSGYHQGKAAAQIARQILMGRPVSQIPINTQSPNRYMFDYHEMTRFGITPSQLPDDSLLINLPPSLYERNKVIIIIFLGAISALLILLTWRLIVQRKQARLLKETNLELDRRVAEQTQSLQTQNSLLQSEIRERQNAEKALIEKADHLENALAKVKMLSGMLPICANCKKIRDDKGYWNQLESYIDDHSEATFSHGICPDCTKQLYPDFVSKLPD